ncbi:MAG: YciI family protein [Hyphomicrobiales bacterium]|nr:YciI family protein [Hyphomicrobiales bacterium]
MLFALVCYDRRENPPTLRAETRPAHLEYLSSLGDAVRAGGALLSADGERVIGSMLIVEADDLAAARSISANDPYTLAGVFESVEIHPWRQAVGAPLSAPQA